MKKAINNILLFLSGAIFGAVIVVILLGSPAIVSKSKGNIIQNNPSAIVSLMVDFGDGNIITCTKKTSEVDTVFELLEACSRDAKNPFELKYKDYPNLGVFIEQIGGQRPSGDKYWQYWVNNQYSSVGSSQYEIESGDIVEWKLIKGQL